jgi:hypothetical protein
MQTLEVDIGAALAAQNPSLKASLWRALAPWRLPDEEMESLLAQLNGQKYQQGEVVWPQVGVLNALDCQKCQWDNIVWP